MVPSPSMKKVLYKPSLWLFKSPSLLIQISLSNPAEKRKLERLENFVIQFISPLTVEFVKLAQQAGPALSAFQIIDSIGYRCLPHLTITQDKRRMTIIE